MKNTSPPLNHFPLAMLAGAALVLAGCQSAETMTDHYADKLQQRAQVATLGPGYTPANVYRDQEKFTESFKRVALLPVTLAESGLVAEAGAETLAPILQAELGKARRFEFAPVTAEQLAAWTGRPAWLADEKLPADFFRKLREATGCDAVLFCRLSHYRPYPPLAIGWQFRLVDAREPRTWWALDEVFDAGNRTVSAAAQRYELDHRTSGWSVNDPGTVLNSPRAFGHYAAAAAFATLPAR